MVLEGLGTEDKELSMTAIKTNPSLVYTVVLLIVGITLATVLVLAGERSERGGKTSSQTFGSTPGGVLPVGDQGC